MDKKIEGYSVSAVTDKKKSYNCTVNDDGFKKRIFTL